MKHYRKRKFYILFSLCIHKGAFATIEKEYVCVGPSIHFLRDILCSFPKTKRGKKMQKSGNYIGGSMYDMNEIHKNPIPTWDYRVCPLTWGLYFLPRCTQEASMVLFQNREQTEGSHEYCIPASPGIKLALSKVINPWVKLFSNRMPRSLIIPSPDMG